MGAVDYLARIVRRLDNTVLPIRAEISATVVAETAFVVIGK